VHRGGPQGRGRFRLAAVGSLRAPQLAHPAPPREHHPAVFRPGQKERTRDMPDEEPRPVLRIFLSSTSEDLSEHRDAVTDAILRVGDLPVTMETFGADPGSPVEVCLERVRGCDALVVLLGERYGWVPGPAEGGEDGRSITWLEVAAALDAQIPVFAFVREPPADGLPAAEAEALGRFREFIDRSAGLTRDTFATPEDLALKVATSLSGWVRRRRRPVRAWLVAALVFGATLLLLWLEVLGGSVDRWTDELLFGTGELFRGGARDERIAIALIDAETESAIGRTFDASWRRESAEVIDRLANAGAALIAFDIAFSSSGPDDGALRRAMERAHERGTPVVIGLTRWTSDGTPAISETLRPAISGFGSLCVRSRNGAVRFAPLALDPSVRNARIPSFAAAAFAAAGGRELEIVALDHRRATVTVDLGGQPRTWRAFEAVRIGESDAGCPLASAGDIEALMALELSRPLAPDARPYLKYEAILTQPPEALAEAVGGRIVLLGRDTPNEHFPVRYALSPGSRLGVELHADALDNLLRGRLAHPASFDLGALLLAPWAFVGVGLARRRQTGIVGLVAASAAIGAISLTLHLALGIVTRPSYAILALLLSYAVLRAARRRGISHAG
jgi:CHASE2 domain-containing sensor protein